MPMDNPDELRRDEVMERKYGRNWQEILEQERDNFDLEDENE